MFYAGASIAMRRTERTYLSTPLLPEGIAETDADDLVRL